ncbi:hypothetical protein G7043_21850 [Lentzea sp. NEAU-D13]|uniref:DUF4232 domain-containing protein n=1 Tax=Lentzea alba TaxID=2714351 RepID=A0A7C9VV00_9PSEU|nr:hypothetical protein [Lentzea alba]NGY61576.1 hypothetical protein [Lentzea alba]
MNPFRKTLSAAVLAGAAVLAVTSAAQGANAQPSAGPVWCTSAHIDVKAHDAHSPSKTDKLFWIRFTAKEGANCKIGGTLSNVRFVDTNGNDVGARLTGGQNGKYVELPVDGVREAAVYVTTKRGGQRFAPAGIIFNLPGQGRLGDLVKLPWPSDLGEFVTVTDLMAPVS